MKKLGLAPAGTEGYLQSFSFSPQPHGHSADTVRRKYTGMNVIGKWDNGAARTAIIGAHYDHLGYGEVGSRHTGEKAIHNGADDNASGVAVLLQLAEWLKTGDQTHNYIFIAFSAEELGLGGSKAFTTSPTIDLRSVSYMINLDMVGRLAVDRESTSKYGKLAVNGTGTSPSFDSVLKTLNRGRFDLVKDPSGIGPSDHTNFYLSEIPVLHFFTGQHQDYHKPEDDAHKLNYSGMYHISKYIVDVSSLLNSMAPLPYVRTKADSSSKAPTLKVTLGVMPDYMFGGSGLKLDGIIPDRPAARAGLEAGDIILSIGDIEVKNIRDYMKALGAYQPGSTSIIRIQRGREIMEREVVF
jgi:hypothetical protein